MSPRRQRTSPDEARRIAEYAGQNLTCDECGAAPGEPCTRPGRGRSVCRTRWVDTAIAIRQAARAARRTPEQEAELAAVLATLPRLSRETIEAGRSPGGGFTRAQLSQWGVPWPPPAGWLATLLRDEVDSR